MQERWVLGSEPRLNMYQHVFILACCLLSPQFVSTRPTDNNKGYHFAYSAKDGTRREESGSFRYIKEKEEPILYVKGFYSYFDGTGREYKFHYEADDKGSRTKGDIIPPLPAQAVTSLPALPPLPPISTTTFPPPLEINAAALASLAGK